VGKKALWVIFFVFLVSTFSPIHEQRVDPLEEPGFFLSIEGNETVNVSGCTNISANNYNENATEDDGSCDFDIDGDGVPDYEEVLGCTNTTAINFNFSATDDDGSCTYFDYSNGSFKHEYWQGYIHGALIRQHEPSFVKFSPDGSYYATHHDGIIQIWDTANVSRTQSASKTITNFSDNWVVDLDWSPDGSHVAIIVTHKLEELGWPFRWTSVVIDYNLVTEEYATLGTHYYNTNYDIGYSPDGSYLGVALGTEFVVYDLLNGDKFLNFSSVDCYVLCNTYHYLSWGPNPKKLTLAWNVLGFISIYDLDSQEFVNQSGTYYRAEKISFSPDGNMIAACTDDDDVALFNSTDVSLIWQHTTPETSYWYMDNSACNEIVWSSDSTKFAVAYDGNGDHGSSVLLYDANTSDVIDWMSITRPNECSGWDCASIEGLDWSPDGNKIIFTADSKEQGIHTWIFDETLEFIPGCTDYTAANYDLNATKMDYSCGWIDTTPVSENYYRAYWDYCEWDQSLTEYLCWVEDLDDLSEETIEELQDCEQSENGCETEQFCQEIYIGMWECAYYDDDNPDNGGFRGESSSFEESKELVTFAALCIIAFVIIMLNTGKKNSGISKIESESNAEEPEKEQVNQVSPPESIEIDIRELL